MFRLTGRSARLCTRFLRKSGILADMMAIAQEQQAARPLSTSAILDKVHKKAPKGQTISIPDFKVQAAFDEFEKAEGVMQDLEERLHKELIRHFSLKVDLRQFEDLPVKLTASGEVHKMSHLGRISLKNSQLVMINFANAPTAIQDAKLALQMSALNVNPQQEGIILYVPVPKMTRERREQLAKDAKGKLLNDYKKAVNDVYIKHDKRASNNAKNLDDAKGKRAALLNLKHQFEKRAASIIDDKQKQLLTEVA